VNPKTIVLGSWAVVIVITTVGWIAGKSPGFPPPGRYLPSAVVFSILYGVAGPLPTLGATVAAGTALAVGFHPYMKGSQVGVFQQAGDILGQLAGTPKVG
jgi:hypothetical protein